MFDSAVVSNKKGRLGGGHRKSLSETHPEKPVHSHDYRAKYESKNEESEEVVSIKLKKNRIDRSASYKDTSSLG
jgi:hypothetical protein